MVDDLYNAEMAAQQERLAKTPDMLRQRAMLVSALSPEAGEDILELGAGNGILLRDLVEKVGADARIVGIDGSEAIVGTARRICPDADFVLGDAQELPFESESFDAVVAAQIFCFLQDPDRSLSEVRRVLRPGGRLVILDTDWATLVWNSRDPDLMKRVMAAYTGLYADPHLPRSLEEKMIRAGFADVGLQSFVILNTTFDENTYARQTAHFATSLMEGSRDFTEEEVRGWLGDLEELARTGRFFFSLNRYIASGVRPA